VGSQGPGEVALFTLFDRPELSGFLTPQEIACQESRGARVVSQTNVALGRMVDILAHNDVCRCDFLNIDVEGREWDVLMGWPWGRMRPKVICVEVISKGMRKFLEEPVVKFLEDAGFTLASRLHCTAVFVDGARAVWR
jgi:hypothetical protein